MEFRLIYAWLVGLIASCFDLFWLSREGEEGFDKFSIWGRGICLILTCGWEGGG